jgi:hypothetical protein
MTAAAPHQETPAAGTARTREAWDAYRESLRELQGRDYEEAERSSWERLQRELEAIAAEAARQG